MGKHYKYIKLFKTKEKFMAQRAQGREVERPRKRKDAGLVLAR